jgi:UDP-N-acetylglucosamine--N-acetylmuramyl-(pentapeptide) pyrophosphoryl-undecaprenol N-acetylglucosamine transferase
MKIIFVWWGTWWHIYPNIAIANKVSSEHKILFIISNSKLDKEILDKTNFKYKQIYSWKLRRYFDIKNFIDPIFILLWFIQSFFILNKFKPDVIFCKWWYVCIPIAIAWWVYKNLKNNSLKIILHESDMVMWLANKIISKFADNIIWWIKDWLNPIRVDDIKYEKLLKIKNIGKLPILLIMWWSQWAKQLNDIVVEIFPKIKYKYYIIHLTWKWKQTNIKDKNYEQYEFLDENYFNILSLADFIISRAWANSIAEILNFKKPSILIPLNSSSWDHQRKNAKYISDKWLAIYLDPINLCSKKIIEILHNNHLINSLKNNLNNFKSINAVEKILEIIQK